MAYPNTFNDRSVPERVRVDFHILCVWTQRQGGASVQSLPSRPNCLGPNPSSATPDCGAVSKPSHCLYHGDDVGNICTLQWLVKSVNMGENSPVSAMSRMGKATLNNSQRWIPRVGEDLSPGKEYIGGSSPNYMCQPYFFRALFSLNLKWGHWGRNLFNV